jgi:hypothetical protein
MEQINIFHNFGKKWKTNIYGIILHCMYYTLQRGEGRGLIGKDAR